MKQKTLSDIQPGDAVVVELNGGIMAGKFIKWDEHEYLGIMFCCDSITGTGLSVKCVLKDLVMSVKFITEEEFEEQLRTSIQMYTMKKADQAGIVGGVN